MLRTSALRPLWLIEKIRQCVSSYSGTVYVVPLLVFQGSVLNVGYGVMY